MTARVTISQAASFAGVTIKTIRHYHRLGLLPEPERDWSGYRRYGSQDLLQLVTIRALAEAGVPLAQIPDLLATSADEFADSVDVVDQELLRQIAELQQRRARLRRLADPDRGMLPASAREVLDRMTTVGLPEDFVAVQREAMILAQAVAPEFLDEVVSSYDHRLDDPELVRLLVRGWEAMAWEPTDPRVEQLAADMAASLLAHPEYLGSPDGLAGRAGARDHYDMINQYGEEDLPAIAVLNQLIEQKLREAGLPIPPTRG